MEVHHGRTRGRPRLRARRRQHIRGPPCRREEGDIKSYLATARNILDTLNSLSWICPSKWRQAYALTLSAFADLVAALDDLKVTPNELTAVCNSFRIAYAAWRAE